MLMIPLPIHIPIGVKNIATARASSWKLISCENCQQGYAYLLDVEAQGLDIDLLFLGGAESRERAEAQARENVAAKIHNSVVPIPCPRCGTYQKDMASQLKEDAWINPVQIAGVIVFLFSFAPLAFAVDYAWIVTVVGAATGLLLLAYGYAVSFGYDPNAGNPAPRKAIGQQNSVWGERLAELVENMDRQAECPQGVRLRKRWQIWR
jgi:hypothetical protein